MQNSYSDHRNVIQFIFNNLGVLNTFLVGGYFEKVDSYRKRRSKRFYIIIRVRSVFLLVASCVLLKYTRTDDVN